MFKGKGHLENEYFLDMFPKNEKVRNYICYDALVGIVVAMRRSQLHPEYHEHGQIVLRSAIALVEEDLSL